MTIIVLGTHIEFKRLLLLVMIAALVIVAFIMLLIGITMATNENEQKPMPSHIMQSLETSSVRLGVAVDLSNASLRQFLQPLAYALIVIGLATVAISILGFLGAWFSIRLALLMYLAITSGMLFVQITFIIFLFGGPLTLAAVIKPYVANTLENYAGIEGTDVDSVAWNAMMSYKKCCGIKDYTDFKHTKKWPAPINQKLYNLTTPVICCKTKTTNYSCAENPTDENNYWKTGCQGKIVKPFVSNNPVPLAVILIYFMCQTALIYCIAWILLC